MKKFLKLSMPPLIVLGLSGCITGTDYTPITDNLRKVESVKNSGGNKSRSFLRYETKIDGEWYESDENGNLTQKGQRKRQVELSGGGGGGGDGGGGGGGC